MPALNLESLSIHPIHPIHPIRPSVTHLDVGFTLPTRNVCDLYLDYYFPKAFNVSAELRGRPERYRWTEFPWLILEFLENSAACAHRPRTADELTDMRNAIAQGDVLWHGNALNNFHELQDAGHLSYALSLAGRLNSMFNQTHGTVTGKHTGVL